MVFAINPPSSGSNTFATFQQLATSLDNSTSGVSSSITSSLATSSVMSSSSAYITPAAPSSVNVTATVTVPSATWTTMYASYDNNIRALLRLLGAWLLLTSSTEAPTPAAHPQDHRVTVGDGGALAFNPSNITASIGDKITFEFHPKNHSVGISHNSFLSTDKVTQVTRSSFLTPCQPLSETDPRADGIFDSGLMPVDTSAKSLPTYTVNKIRFSPIYDELTLYVQITVNDTAPIWVYCKQTVMNHCGNGMNRFSTVYIRSN
jgi:plastocyanin